MNARASALVSRSLDHPVAYGCGCGCRNRWRKHNHSRPDVNVDMQLDTSSRAKIYSFTGAPPDGDYRQDCDSADYDSADSERSFAGAGADAAATDHGAFGARESDDAGVTYTFDHATGPRAGADVLCNAVEAAAERFEHAQTERLVLDEYEVLDGDGEAAAVARRRRQGKAAAGRGQGKGKAESVRLEEEEYEFL